MCSNYVPVTRMDRLLGFFGVQRPRDEVPEDVYPSGLAPFIRLRPAGDDGEPALRVVDDAIFRFVPDFAARVDWARATYNARSETVATRSTYKDAWAAGQRCIIPAEAFYEPNYESGTAVRWAIFQPGSVPMGIAGIYRAWTHPDDGREMFAMAMLTVDAGDHPFMRRFHKPGEEKRMVVILDPDNYAEWLSCPVPEAHKFLRQWHGPLEGVASPPPPRAPRSAPAKRPQRRPSPPDGGTGDLFG